MRKFRFHVSVHAAPRDKRPGPQSVINGIHVETLDVTPAQLAEPMGTSFEDASAALEKLERMFLEPDGSFVWVSPQSDLRWQIDGVLYDRAGRLMFVDLKGDCTEEALDQLLSALCADKKPLMFQLVREAVFLDDEQFRRACEVES
jgi:hypothetical protein